MEEKELIPIDVKYQIEQYKISVENAVAFVSVLDIQTKAEAENALDIAYESINLSERIEQTTKAITSPARAFAAEVNKLSRDFTIQLSQVKETIVEKLNQWKSINNEIRTLETSKMSSHDKLELIYEVEDLEKLDRRYLCVDEELVKLAMKQGLRSIPGLRITEKKTTTLRRK